MKKVNTGPSSARIYRSNVPFSAQPMVPEPILEETYDEAVITQPVVQPPVLAAVTREPQQQLQSAGDSYASEKPPVVRVPSVKWSTPAVRDSKAPQASPLR